jgi:hypothetical protein
VIQGRNLLCAVNGKQRLKYFLYEFEEHLAEKKGAVPRISWEEIRRRERADTIEHILPQTPTDAYWNRRFDEDALRLYTHDLGNLTLTKDNVSYGNKPFPEKRGMAGSGRPCYAESPFFAERELANLTDWTVEHVLERRSRLIDWALDRWHIELDQPLYIPAMPASAGEPEDSQDLEVGD